VAHHTETDSRFSGQLVDGHSSERRRVRELITDGAMARRKRHFFKWWLKAVAYSSDNFAIIRE